MTLAPWLDQIMMDRPETPGLTRANWLLGLGVFASWGVFSIHHAYEAGLAQVDSPLEAASAIEMTIISSVMLVTTLAFLHLYRRNRDRKTFLLFSAVTLFWWVGITGLVEGFYSHTLKDVLYFFFNVSPATMPMPMATLSLAYDVPTNVFGEATGILPFVFGVLTAVAWRSLSKERSMTESKTVAQVNVS